MNTAVPLASLVVGGLLLVGCGAPSPTQRPAPPSTTAPATSTSAPVASSAAPPAVSKEEFLRVMHESAQVTSSILPSYQAPPDTELLDAGNYFCAKWRKGQNRDARSLFTDIPPSLPGAKVDDPALTVLPAASAEYLCPEFADLVHLMSGQVVTAESAPTAPANAPSVPEGSAVSVSFLPTDGSPPMAIELPAGWSFHELGSGENDPDLMRQMGVLANGSGQGTAQEWLGLMQVKSGAQGIALGPDDGELMLTKHGEQGCPKAGDLPATWTLVSCREHQGRLDATVQSARAPGPLENVVFVDVGEFRFGLDGRSAQVLEAAAASIVESLEFVSAD